MRIRRLLPLATVALLAAACACTCPGACPCGYTSPPSTARPVLAQRWLLGIERMRNDPAPLQPYSNRLVGDLAAMPQIDVVGIDTDRNAFLFEASTANKIRVAPWLRGEESCMTVTYTVYRGGRQQGTYGLIVPALALGVEPDSACVDRFATEFYWALVRQGL